uniref:(northern house mosquito) hypothetical protein n=1 Tax=Culex pipiens TaxID=7175 RepID=A0A8D8MPD9_CULPI
MTDCWAAATSRRNEQPPKGETPLMPQRRRPRVNPSRLGTTPRANLPHHRKSPSKPKTDDLAAWMISSTTTVTTRRPSQTFSKTPKAWRTCRNHRCRRCHPPLRHHRIPPCRSWAAAATSA